MYFISFGCRKLHLNSNNDASYRISMKNEQQYSHGQILRLDYNHLFAWKYPNTDPALMDRSDSTSAPGSASCGVVK
jgi:hypothetical protein